MLLSNPYRYILPEIHTPRESVAATPFPLTCPSCGAALTSQQATGLVYKRTASYACGATYTSKPQIQNHTEKWWGTCPVTKAEVAAES